MTPDDLDADVPWLVKAMLQNGTLWSPYKPVDLDWIQAKLWERDEPERSKHFPSKDPALPQRLLGWREPYARALLAAVVLGEWVEATEDRDFRAFGERRREVYRVTQKAKTDFSPLAGVLVSDENIRKNLMVGVDFSALEHRVLAQLAEQEPLKDFGFDVSSLLAPDKHEAVVTVLVKKRRSGGDERVQSLVFALDALTKDPDDG